MKTRKTEVCWDAGLIRVEYLDAEGTPYYCEFEERAKLPGDVPAGIATGPARLSGPAIPALAALDLAATRAQAEPIKLATKIFPARPNQE